MLRLGYKLMSEEHGPSDLVRNAHRAEAAGFESVWVGEHVVLPIHPPEWFTMPSTLPFLDSIAALTLLAAHTSRVKIGSGILDPVLARGTVYTPVPEN